LQGLLAQAKLELQYKARHQPRNDYAVDTRASDAIREFAKTLPRIRTLLDSDILAAYQGDPAAGSVDEVLLCYPGILDSLTELIL